MELYWSQNIHEYVFCHQIILLLRKSVHQPMTIGEYLRESGFSGALLMRIQN